MSSPQRFHYSQTAASSAVSDTTAQTRYPIPFETEEKATLALPRSLMIEHLGHLDHATVRSEQDRDAERMHRVLVEPLQLMLPRDVARALRWSELGDRLVSCGCSGDQFAVAVRIEKRRILGRKASEGDAIQRRSQRNCRAR